MSKFKAPVIKCPADGSVLVNARRVLVLEMDAPLMPSPPGTLSLSIGVQTVHDTTGPGSLTSPSKLKTTTGKQNDMASATAPGKSNGCDFVGASVSGSGVVKDVAVKLAAMGVFKSDAYEPGLSEIRAVAFYKGNEVWRSSQLSTTKWTGSTKAALYTSTSIQAALTTILGAAFDLDDLNALLNATTGGLPDFEINVAADEDEAAAFVGTWYASGLSLEVTYFGGVLDTQGAYQWQGATDSGFSSVVWDTGKTAGDSRFEVVRPGQTGGTTPQLPDGELIYWRARRWDAATDTASDWSATVTCTTMGEAMSRALTEPDSTLVQVLELRSTRFIGGGCWVREASPNDSVVSTSFHRSLEPIVNFWIASVEEAGVDVGYTEVFSVADCQATAKTFFFDEAGVEGTPGVLYAHTSDARDPAAFADAGLGIVVSLPLAERPIACGPGNLYRADPRLTQSLATKDVLSDDARVVLQTPASGARLKNHDKLFHKLLGGAQDPGGSRWLSHNRPARIHLSGLTSIGTVPWEQTLITFDGVAQWDDQGLVGEELSLKLLPPSYMSRVWKLAHKKHSTKMHANLNPDYVGQAIPESVGLGLKRWPLTVADEANGLLKAHKKNATCTNVYANGQQVYGWTFNKSLGYVTFKGAAYGPGKGTFLDPLGTGVGGDDVTWTFDGSGEQYNGLDIQLAGDMAQWLLEKKLGVSSTAIDARTFAHLQALEPAAAVADVGFVIDSELQVAEVIKTVAQTGMMWILKRLDGKWIGLPDVPPGWTANTLLLTDADLLSVPRWWYGTAHMAEAPGVNYHTWSKGKGNQSKKVSYPQPLPASMKAFVLQGEKIVETYHTTQAGALAVVNAVPWFTPYLYVSFDARKAAYGLQPGDGVALNLATALDRSGALNWGLFQVWDKQTGGADGHVTIVARKVGTLDPQGRPW